MGWHKTFRSFSIQQKERDIYKNQPSEKRYTTLYNRHK